MPAPKHLPRRPLIPRPPASWCSNQDASMAWCAEEFKMPGGFFGGYDDLQNAGGSSGSSTRAAVLVENTLLDTVIDEASQNEYDSFCKQSGADSLNRSGAGSLDAETLQMGASSRSPTSMALSSKTTGEDVKVILTKHARSASLSTALAPSSRSSPTVSASDEERTDKPAQNELVGSEKAQEAPTPILAETIPEDSFEPNKLGQMVESCPLAVPDNGADNSTQLKSTTDIADVGSERRGLASCGRRLRYRIKAPPNLCLSSVYDRSTVRPTAIADNAVDAASPRATSPFVKTPEARTVRSSTVAGGGVQRRFPNFDEVSTVKSGHDGAFHGHTTQPKQQGQRVAVVGDGWGGGSGGYEAIVTEADRLTFTVVAVTGSEPWQETHVLKEHCIPVRGSESVPAAAKILRPRTAKIRRLCG